MSQYDQSKDLRDNDPYAAFERASSLIWDGVQEALLADEAHRISDEAVARLLTAAVKLYARKTDGERRTFRPLGSDSDDCVTATEALTAVTEMLRCLNLGPVEFALWSRRLPENHYLTDFGVSQSGNVSRS